MCVCMCSGGAGPGGLGGGAGGGMIFDPMRQGGPGMGGYGPRGPFPPRYIVMCIDRYDVLCVQ